MAAPDSNTNLGLPLFVMKCVAPMRITLTHVNVGFPVSPFSQTTSALWA